MDETTWKKIISEIKPISFSIASLLSSSKLLDFNGDKLKLGVYYKFHKDKLEEAKTLKMIEKACRNVLGNNTRVEFCLAEAPVVQNKANLSDIDDNSVLKAAEDLFL